GEVDPLYFDASYYVGPEEGGAKAYKLLMMAMEESAYAAIAKVTMHQREHIVVIRPRAKGLTLHTMFYTNEIRAAESIPTDQVEVKDQEKKLAHQLIESQAATIEAKKYSDEIHENIKTMNDEKLKG